MKRGCTQCGDCLDVCPIFALYRREEYSPRETSAMEPLDGWGGGETPLPWKTIRRLSRLCAGCGRCARRCARKLSTSELLADLRSQHPHWTQFVWDIWIRRVGPLCRCRTHRLVAFFCRAVRRWKPPAPYCHRRPPRRGDGSSPPCRWGWGRRGCIRRMHGAQRPPRLDCAG
ncbi:MAG: 4Fe-4S dicluster domain-containing protein [Bilophila wadsworthia]